MELMNVAIDYSFPPSCLGDIINPQPIFPRLGHSLARITSPLISRLPRSDPKNNQLTFLVDLWVVYGRFTRIYLAYPVDVHNSGPDKSRS